MTTDGRDQEVFLVPLGEDSVLAIPVDDADDSVGGRDVDVSTLIKAVGPLIGAALKGRGVSSASVYELSPESLKMLEEARLDKVGDYFRGVLRNTDGKISHQVQLREVKATPAPARFDPLAAAQLAQMAAIQAQLNRIEDTLSDLSMGVEDVMQFLEVQQRARVEAALRVLCELHDRARETGELSDTDWHRLTGVELDLETQLRAVRIEFSQRLSDRTFAKSPSADAKQMKAVDPKRIGDLLRLHRMLLGGLRGWNELLLLRKFSASELTEGEASAALERLRSLEARHDQLVGQIKSVASASRKSKARSSLQRLFTDGLILGGSNDQRDLGIVKDGRKALNGVLESVPTALPQVPERKMLDGPPGAEPA